MLFRGRRLQSSPAVVQPDSRPDHVVLLAVATSSLLIPAAFHATTLVQNSYDAVLALSRGTSFVLLVIYLLYLLFQLKTHSQFFEESPDSADDSENHHVPVLEPWEAIVMLSVVTLAVAFCTEYLVDSIDSIVQQTGIGKTFIGLILLPIVGNAAGLAPISLWPLLFMCIQTQLGL